MSQRSSQLELLDLGPDHYTQKEYDDCLFKLDRIGRFLGGDQATYWGFRQVEGAINSILDLGCGGGLFTARLAEKYPDAYVTGMDLDPHAIAFAKKHAKGAEFIQGTLPEKAYDVITCTLVCHHMSDDVLIDFLTNAKKLASSAIVINDLHRNPFAYYSFKTIAPLFFPNRLITHDGPLSVQRAFTKEDWKRYLKAAGITNYSITWHLAFRWIIVIKS